MNKALTGKEAPVTRPLKSALIYQAKLARRSARRLRRVRRSGIEALAASPVLFANSFPKSGTHLLTQILAGFTRFGPAVESGLPAITTFDGATGRQRAEAEILDDLRRLLPGDIAYGHLHALPGVIQALCRPGVAAYFILRDPRDVVVSHVHYVTEMAPKHVHHHFYKNVLTTFDERLSASIQGSTAGGHPLPDIRARFEPYMGWLECAEILTLRFEDFITEREEMLDRIFTHAVGRGFSPVGGDSATSKSAALQMLADGIAPERSPTFRSGKIGGWRAAFAEQHKQMFKEVSGDLLIRLGYETDDAW